MRTLSALLLVTALFPLLESEARSEALRPICSPAEFGAVGNGQHDDRKAIQDALAACKVVAVPPGRYLVGQGAGFYNLLVGPGRTLSGAGRGLTTLVQAPGIGAAVRLLHVAGGDATIADLTLDGDRGHQSVNEQRHGVFAASAPRLALVRVTSQNFTGDGFYVYTGSDNVVMNDVLATGNGRNGATLGGGGSRGHVITSSTFRGNRAQQFDTEQGVGYTVDDVLVTGSTFDPAGVSNDYALTISGSRMTEAPGTRYPSHGWRVIGNTIHGGVFAVWVDDSIIANNTGINPTTKPCYEVYRRSVRVSIIGNTCTHTQTEYDGIAGIRAIGTSVNEMPESIVIANNTITSTGQYRAFGVHAQSVVSAEITGNTLVGPGLSAPLYAAGVYLRTTMVDAPFQRAVVDGNTIVNWGDSGVRVAGNAPLVPVVEYLEIKDNDFGDDSTPTAQTRAVRFDGQGLSVTTKVLSGNTCTGGTSCAGANL